MEQVIGDILDQYERHLGYLHLRRAQFDDHEPPTADLDIAHDAVSDADDLDKGAPTP